MSDHDDSFMRREIDAIPGAVARLLEEGADELAAAGRALAARDPSVLVTVARGSSDHAAAFLKYAVELVAGIPVASVGPSVASVYGARMRLDGAACLAISQSGRSPDIVDMARLARASGALSLALTNTPGSPLAAACDRAIDIRAGAERSVAATKTFVNSAVAGLALLAAWRNDARLAEALDALPGHLERALDADWTALADALAGDGSVFILGRGPAFAIAEEAALKFKETCQLHAEAYSAAEVMHGPVSLVGAGFPVLVLAARDAAEAATVATADALADKGARVFVTAAGGGRARRLGFAATGHPLTDPLALIVAFYGFVERFARSTGHDPDRPVHLRKVTETR